MSKFQFKKGGSNKRTARQLKTLAKCEVDGVEYELCADSYLGKAKKGEEPPTNHVLVLRAPKTGINDTRLGAPKFCAFAQMMEAGLAHLAKVTPDLVQLAEEDDESEEEEQASCDTPQPAATEAED